MITEKNKKLIMSLVLNDEVPVKEVIEQLLIQGISEIDARELVLSSLIDGLLGLTGDRKLFVYENH